MFESDKWYFIKFLDHCNGFEAIEPMEIEIFVYVIEEKSKYIYGTTWRPVVECDKTFDDNLEKVSIIKSTIIEFKPFEA
jgi:hypothetical protein